MLLRPDARAVTGAAGPVRRAIDPFGGRGVVGFHPGLLSGVALAGANRPPEPGQDDGILTATEVAELDLSGVELVALSACETGLGESAGGEGVLGLQRAFQEAGVGGVVASLWSVDDAATRALMERFYQNLWQERMGKLAALREAQLWMLRGRPAGGRGMVVRARSRGRGPRAGLSSGAETIPSRARTEFGPSTGRPSCSLAIGARGRCQEGHNDSRRPAMRFSPLIVIGLTLIVGIDGQSIAQQANAPEPGRHALLVGCTRYPSLPRDRGGWWDPATTWC